MEPIAKPAVDPARDNAFEQLVGQLRRALVDRREVAEIGDFKFRFQRRGEVFDGGQHDLQARESGIFVCLPVTAGGQSMPGRWVHHGSSDDLHDILGHFLHGKDARALEEIRVNLSASVALRDSVRERPAARATDGAQDATEPSPHDKAYDALMARLRRALVERRDEVQIDEFRFRFQRRGETFDDDANDQTLQARESGLFVYCPAMSGGKPVPGRWLYHGSTDDLPDIMQRFLQGKDARALEEIGITISANAVLQDMARERSQARERSSASRATRP